MGTPITVIVVDDHKGDQWQLIAAVVWKRKNEMTYSWWRVFSGPHSLRSYEILPIPVFTEWWT